MVGYTVRTVSHESCTPTAFNDLDWRRMIYRGDQTWSDIPFVLPPHRSQNSRLAGEG